MPAPGAIPPEVMAIPLRMRMLNDLMTPKVDDAAAELRELRDEVRALRDELRPARSARLIVGDEAARIWSTLERRFA